MLGKTEGAIKNGKSRDTYNIMCTRHKTKKKSKQNKATTNTQTNKQKTKMMSNMNVTKH